MRGFLALLIAATGTFVGVTVVSTDVEAADYYRYRGKYYRVTKACGHDCARARALDPGGNYKAYPDWARAALSPKTDGRGSRSR
jgi:hypothetical protein